FIKRIGKIHNKAKENLELIMDSQRSKTENMLEVLQEILVSSYECTDNNKIANNFKSIVAKNGGYESLIKDCTEITAYSNKNYYPLLWKSFKSHRKTFFEILKILSIGSTTDNKYLIIAIDYLLTCELRKSEFIDANVDLSFANKKWQKIVICKVDGKEVFSRRYFELCVFSYIASDFKTGDIYVDNSDEYADYRNQLLTWDECIPLLNDYCEEINLPLEKVDFIENLKSMLKNKCEQVDNGYYDNVELVIQTDGEILLKRTKSTRDTVKVKEFKRQIEQYMPERNLMEILCNVEHWVNFTKHFGPLSGSEPKLKNPKERYIVLTFGYGSNMGPTQTSKHIRGDITPYMIHFTNKRHISETKLDKAIADIINEYNKFSLPKIWGDINVVAADGTQIDMYSQNLLSENHIRYGGMGAIAYHHVSDTYIALFSHFIPCGVWEAVYIIDGLLKNKSDIQPDIVHGDTQGQSSTVFALTYMLGIKLMPRIRNWKDLKFYKATNDLKYTHIEALFKDTINWNLIDTHYKDLFQVVLSIKSGKILPSTLLRKLNNDSKKNKLFQAFRELGKVIRTIYLLEFISNVSLRIKLLTY
ncbi:MAG: transposase, partial [Clostridium sp.]